jgi:antitoxin component YwqK of YwqJK toxin-antitoxin module
MKNLRLFLILLCILFLGAACTKVKYEYYENGRLKSETHYRFGKETGVTTYYHQQYAIKTMEVEMKSGKRNGKLTKRYFDGSTALIAYYKDDLLDGVETYYFSNGNRNLETHYTNGVKNGSVTSWYSDGIIKESGAFVDDLYDGKWESYDERGLPTGEGLFVKGTGKRIIYDEMGHLQMETNFVNNKKEGLETHFFPNGKIEKTYLFKEDRIIEINGVPIEN